MTETQPVRNILATDLDGTLIPLNADPASVRDLKVIGQNSAAGKLELVFVSGRHFESVLDAIEEFQLPNPDVIIADVGSSIYSRKIEVGDQKPNTFVSEQPFICEQRYADHLAELANNLSIDQIDEILASVGDLRKQEPEKLSRFKLSYYVPAESLDKIAEQIRILFETNDVPWSILTSVDPFNGDGLVDLLPAGVNKAYALQWWLDNFASEQVNAVFSGDSGNDWAAMTSDFQTIVVGNANRQLARAVYDHHQAADTLHQVYLAQEEATSGVLEGLRWFELIERDIDVTRDGTTESQGANCLSRNHARFTVVAPNCKSVSINTLRRGWQRTVEMPAVKKGLFSIELDQIGPGDRYGFILDGRSENIRPDPRSRFQPDGVHQRSQLQHHASFPWQDAGWTGIDRAELIIYELHIGTFSEGGTFRSAIDKIDELVELGITAIELLPIAQSAGTRNWGYDGVNLFAPFSPYGTPDDLKAFVDAAHLAGIAVLLDVVYNHPGPEGNYLAEFAPYFSKKHHTPWGPAYNFDGTRKKLARRLVVENVLYWLNEFHFDGLRFDAIHFMFDDSEYPIQAEITDAVRDLGRRQERHFLLIGETNIFDANMIRDREEGGMGFDAIWCDDQMHAAYSIGSPETRLTERTYQQHSDLVESMRHGYLYQGPPNERVSRSDDRAADVSHVPALVVAVQTHDSVGNEPTGQRLHQLTNANFQQAAAALNLLYPAIPMIFMGDEDLEPNPFQYFVDFKDPRLVNAIENSRKNEHPQQDWRDAMSPFDRNAFEGSKRSIAESEPRLAMRKWYQSLIKIRKSWRRRGLLAATGMSITYDESTYTIQTTYRCDGEEANVVVRLMHPDRSDEPKVCLNVAGPILLCSTQHVTELDQQVSLGSNEVLVAMGSVTRSS